MGDGRAKDLAGLMCPPSSWFFFDAVRTAARRAVRPDKRRAGPNIDVRPEQIVGFFRRPPDLQEGLGSSDGTASRWMQVQAGRRRQQRSSRCRDSLSSKEAGGRAGASFSVDPDRGIGGQPDQSQTSRRQQTTDEVGRPGGRGPKGGRDGSIVSLWPTLPQRFVQSHTTVGSKSTTTSAVPRVRFCSNYFQRTRDGQP